MTQQTSSGLMQALAPIATRRPVHLIVSGAANGLVHVICQPLQMGADEDPEIARGFAVDASPEELDRDLPRLITEGWVPAHKGLQSVLDQVAAAAAQAREATLRKEKDKGKGKANGTRDATGGAQTTLAPPPAEAGPAAAEPTASAVPAAAEPTVPVPAETAAAPANAEPPAPAAAQPAGCDPVASLFE